MRSSNSRRVAAAAFALMAFVLGACTTRGPSSPYIFPPENTAIVEWESQLAALMESPEAALPSIDYILGPGDVLALSLLGRPDLLGEDEDRPGGRIRFTITESPLLYFPHIGALTVHGKTPEQLQTELQDAYGRIVRNPAVFLTVDKYYRNQLSVLGSVRTPGRFSIEPGDTLLDAIFKAGGLSMGGRSAELPPARVLKVYRDTSPSRVTSAADLEALMHELRDTGTFTRRQEITVPLDTFLLGGNLAYNLPVLPGDIIYIPPAGTVSMHGAVARPRVVFLGPGLRTLAQVITECGGIQFRAASRVEIVRMDREGNTRSYFINARKVMKREVPDFYLEDNDQIFFYINPGRNVLSAIGSVFRATASTGVNATYNPVQ